MIKSQTSKNARRARFRSVAVDLGEPAVYLPNRVGVGLFVRRAAERREFLIGAENGLDETFWPPRGLLLGNP